MLRSQVHRIFHLKFSAVIIATRYSKRSQKLVLQGTSEAFFPVTIQNFLQFGLHNHYSISSFTRRSVRPRIQTLPFLIFFVLFFFTWYFILLFLFLFLFHLLQLQTLISRLHKPHIFVCLQTFTKESLIQRDGRRGGEGKGDTWQHSDCIYSDSGYESLLSFLVCSALPLQIYQSLSIRTIPYHRKKRFGFLATDSINPHSQQILRPRHHKNGNHCTNSWLNNGNDRSRSSPFTNYLHEQHGRKGRTQANPRMSYLRTSLQSTGTSNETREESYERETFRVCWVLQEICPEVYSSLN